MASGDELWRLSERKNESDAGARVPAGRGEGGGGEVEPLTLGFFAEIVASYWPTGALQRVFSQIRKLKTAFLP